MPAGGLPHLLDMCVVVFKLFSDPSYDAHALVVYFDFLRSISSFGLVGVDSLYGAIEFVYWGGCPKVWMAG